MAEHDEPYRSRLVRVRPTDESHRVTTLELFFDLVFVFAFTQVTQLMADDPTASGALRGLVLMALLWWAWCSYAWLGNQAHADEGVVRLTVIVAMAAMFVVALSIPESFADRPGGLFAPFVLAACYAVVRLAHLACYLVAAGDDAGWRGRVASRSPAAGPRRTAPRARSSSRRAAGGPACPARCPGRPRCRGRGAGRGSRTGWRRRGRGAAAPGSPRSPGRPPRRPGRGRHRGRAARPPTPPCPPHPSGGSQWFQRRTPRDDLVEHGLDCRALMRARGEAAPLDEVVHQRQ